jgi:Domain of unknown function (DUF4169)
MREGMGDIVNLRRIRKEKARTSASKEAAANRAKSGRTAPSATPPIKHARWKKSALRRIGVRLPRSRTMMVPS